MQMGPPGSHKMVLDFSNIILGFDSMYAAVERAEKMVGLIIFPRFSKLKLDD